VRERPPETFLEGPVRMSDERRSLIRAEVTAAVEELKSHAFDLLERHT
jgi:hypothetical protein